MSINLPLAVSQPFWQWKEWAIKCGARPRASARNIKMTYRYQWSCEKCGDLNGGFHRKPKHTYGTHRNCGAALILKDTETGNILPHPAKVRPQVSSCNSAEESLAIIQARMAASSVKPMQKPFPRTELDRIYEGNGYRIVQLKSKTITVHLSGQKVQAFKHLKKLAIEQGLTFDFDKINTRSLGNKLLNHLLNK